MKKRLLTVGLMILCLVLAACTATDPNNLFGETSQQDALVPSQISADDRYQYGNMQKMPSGEFSRLGILCCLHSFQMERLDCTATI